MVLRLTQDWPWTLALARAFQRLRLIPLPAGRLAPRRVSILDKIIHPVLIMILRSSGNIGPANCRGQFCQAGRPETFPTVQRPRRVKTRSVCFTYRLKESQ